MEGSGDGCWDFGDRGWGAGATGLSRYGRCPSVFPGELVPREEGTSVRWSVGAVESDFEFIVSPLSKDCEEVFSVGPVGDVGGGVKLDPGPR